MDVLILIVFGFLLVALFGGLLSLQHAIIKPVVDWLNPTPSLYVPPPDDLSEPAMAGTAESLPAPPATPHGTPDGMYAVRKLQDEQTRASRPKPRGTPDVRLAGMMEKLARKRHIRQAIAAHDLVQRSMPSSRPRLP